MKALLEKISNNTARIGVLGLGYVGLPLALAFSKKFSTIGFDVNEKCINLLSSGKSYILDIQDADLKQSLNNSFIITLDEF